MKTYIKLLLIIIFIISFILFNIPISKADQYRKENCWTSDLCEAYEGEWELQTKCGTQGDAKLGFCYNTFSYNNIATGESTDYIPLQIKIPIIGGVDKIISDYSDQVVTEGNSIKGVKSLGVYLAILFAYFVSAIGIVAVAMIAWGGYQWIMAAGSADQISKAKNTIQGAIIGLVLAVGSVVLLNMINSRLVEFEPIRTPKIKPIHLTDKCSLLKTQSNNPSVRLSSSPQSQSVQATKAECGLEYVIVGSEDQTCMGDYCVNSASGLSQVCLPLTEIDPLNPTKKFGCATAENACESIDDDEIETTSAVLGVAEDSDGESVYNDLCQIFTTVGNISVDEPRGECAWVEIHGLAMPDDQCDWFTRDKKAAVCSKVSKNFQKLDKDADPCNAYQVSRINSNYTYPARIIDREYFAACRNNWCNTDDAELGNVWVMGRSCYTEWSAGGWECISKQISY